MPQPFAKSVRIEVPYLHSDTIITATIGPSNWVLKLPRRYRHDQAARLLEQRRTRFITWQ
jgi:hypothetical protein